MLLLRMYLHIVVTTILCVTTIGQEYYLHYLNQDQDELIECIENSKLIKNAKKLRGSDFIHTFAVFAGGELFGKKNVDTNSLNHLIESFRDQPHNFPSTSSGRFWNDELVDVLRNTMVHCSDDYDFKLCKATNHLANRRLIPGYENELDRPQISRYLDLALTNFPESTSRMASTPTGFMTLMRFTMDFVNATVQLYNSFHSNANEARVAVRNALRNRIHNWERPVCRYHYDATDGKVYTCGCNMDTSRYPNITERKKNINYGEIWSVLRFFVSYSSRGQGDDAYNRYVNQGMRVYERNFELLLLEKYRLMIFIYWLRLRHILIDQSDVTKDLIDYMIPSNVWNILKDDKSYANEMTELRENCRIRDVQNPLEEDIISRLDSVFQSKALNVTAYFIDRPYRPSTTKKPFYRRFGDQALKYIKAQCSRNHKGKSSSGDANSNPQNNQRDSENSHQCDYIDSNYGKNEAKFLVQAIGFTMSSRPYVGLLLSRTI